MKVRQRIEQIFSPASGRTARRPDHRRIAGGCLICYRIYRRLRASFGKQPIQTKRMIVRVVLLASVGSLMLWLAIHSMALLGAAAAGLAGGGAVAALGPRLTKWHSDATGTYYTPNAYIGAAISAVLIARIIYRLITMAGPAMQGAVQPDSNPFASFQQSPLTLSILMLMIGYYLVYFTGLLLVARSRPAP